MQTNVHIQKYKQKWNYLVQQFMLSLFRSCHSKYNTEHLSQTMYPSDKIKKVVN